MVGIGCVRGLFANVATRGGDREWLAQAYAGLRGWRDKVAIRGCDREWLAQVYAGHRGGRDKVAIKVMQVPGDHREGVTEGGWRRCTRGAAAGARRWRSR